MDRQGFSTVLIVVVGAVVILILGLVLFSSSGNLSFVKNILFSEKEKAEKCMQACESLESCRENDQKISPITLQYIDKKCSKYPNCRLKPDERRELEISRKNFNEKLKGKGEVIEIPGKCVR